MRRHPPSFGVALLIAVVSVLGCKPQEPFYLRDKGDPLSHYIGVATEIDYPDVKDCPLPEVEGACRPYSLANAAPKEIWNLTLEEAIRIALQNSKVMRQIGGQIQGPPDFITRQGAAPTIYDPAIEDTDARFGVEAALSLFDAQWNTDIFWEKNHQPAGYDPYITQQSAEDTAQCTTQVSKTNATGGQVSVRNITNYYLLNLIDPTTGVQSTNRSSWNTNFEMEVRQPLFQGAGVEFNRIAGPGAIPGFNQGVMIARINTDIALTQFEAGVRNVVSDVEVAYWELYFAYRSLDAAVVARNRTLETWRKANALFGGRDGGPAPKSVESQARLQWFTLRSTTESSLYELYRVESKLRYMLGLAATDCRLIRPADEPTTAKITFDWCDSSAEAISRMVEIRQAKWRVKLREMELIAAKNYLLPRVDAIGRYRWLGAGPDLLDRNDNSASTGGAFENLGTGEFQNWHLGIQAQVPLGFRKQLAGVRHAELALARERAILREIELEVSHQLAFAFRDLESNLTLAQTNFSRRAAAERNLEAQAVLYDTIRDQNLVYQVNAVLQAQSECLQADSAYYRSLVDYAKAITQVHFRKGSLLEYNGVYLAEGPWPAKAYFDAKRRAKARNAGICLDYGFTLPKVISRGPYQQNANDPHAAGDTPAWPPKAETPSDNETQTPEHILAPKANEEMPAKEPAKEPAKPAAPEPGRKADLQGTGTSAPLGLDARPAGRRDLGSLNLNLLGGKSADTADCPATAVNNAAYFENHETVANPSPAETHQPAPGWQGVQR